MHGGDGGAQKLVLLVAPPVTASLVPASALGDLLDPWLADVDGDAVVDEYQFTRNPLVCRVELDGHPVEVIGAHLKSNFINQGERMWNDPARRLEFVRSALRNRRRIASDGMRTRLYLDRRLGPEPDAAIVVLDDVNDGPVFDDFVTEEPAKRLLLAHIIASPAVAAAGAQCARLPGRAGSNTTRGRSAAPVTGPAATSAPPTTDQPPCGCRPSGSAVGQTRA